MKSNEQIGIDSKKGLKPNSAAGYIRNIISENSGGISGKNLGYGVRAALAKTALKRLPPPLNFVAPLIAEKLIMAYGVDGGRDVLLKGLRWVKKITDDKPEQPVVIR